MDLSALWEDEAFGWRVPTISEPLPHAACGMARLLDLWTSAWWLLDIHVAIRPVASAPTTSSRTTFPLQDLLENVASGDPETTLADKAR